MFTKQELQVLGQTLAQRREWLSKNLHKPEHANNKTQNEKTLQIIESALAKLTTQLRSSSTTHEATDANEGDTEGSREQIAHYISNKTTSPIRQAAVNRRQQLSPHHIKVLLVDDDNFICEILCAFLRAVGISQIDTANDGMKGISMMYEANPVYDLVLCDWNMPIKSGIDVHNAMRAAERYMGTVFMLVTAVTEAKLIREAIDEGVDDYVVKPIEQDKLIKKITRHFPQVKAPAPQE